MSESPPATPVAAHAQEALPRVFGRYVLFDQIGRGGMADIYLARADTELGGSRLAVVKQILPELTRDAAFERMFISEAKLAAELRNGNIVQVFDLGREGERLYIGMEYVEGFDLHQLLRELSRNKVPLPAEFGLFIVREVLSALSYAHRSKRGDGQPLGIVHRDVSPSNVLISFEGEVKLCDFGIARALTAHGGLEVEDPGVASSTRVVGKSAYMAPEQARGEPLDARADVFAAGILLWELSAGRRLYKGDEAQMLQLAREAKVPPLARQGVAQQQMLQTVLDRALARFRDDRFQSATDMQRALDEYMAEAKLVASQLRFGTFLTDHFAKEIVQTRRSRERAAREYQSTVPSIPSPRVGAEDAAAASAVVDEGRTAGWNEPGRSAGPTSSGEEGDVRVVELGSTGGGVDLHSVADPEVEANLAALTAVPQQAAVAAPSVEAQVSTQPQQLSTARGSAESERWMYAVAVVILAAGVLAYFWR